MKEIEKHEILPDAENIDYMTDDNANDDENIYDVLNDSMGEKLTDENYDFLIKMQLAKFYLKLESKKLVPVSTLQDLAEELSTLTKNFTKT